MGGITSIMSVASIITTEIRDATVRKHSVFLRAANRCGTSQSVLMMYFLVQQRSTSEAGAKWAKQDGAFTPMKFFGKGCTHPDAHNYNPLISEDDGSCLFRHQSCRNDYCRDWFQDCQVHKTNPGPDDEHPACAGQEAGYYVQLTTEENGFWGHYQHYECCIDHY